ncbi:hypothetical protein MBUL_01390 [Methylobacterium bullatum]|uniref:Uncharacterized protein n=1 Tax=Methylobacterium bullatum TaxID=570505 RepID=A0A679IXH1_9HYPH|nr:hypothetical protein MBUL_01390 [Methylobacterium bullatum]
MARLLRGEGVSLPLYQHGFGPMHDTPLLLNLLYAILMASSMMITWQVHRLLGRA